MNTRLKNLVELENICNVAGLHIAQTNSRTGGYLKSVRIYTSKSHFGKPDLALFTFGGYVNRDDIREVKTYISYPQTKEKTK